MDQKKGFLTSVDSDDDPLTLVVKDPSMVVRRSKQAFGKYGLGRLLPTRRSFLCLPQSLLTDEVVDAVIDHAGDIPAVAEITPPAIDCDRYEIEDAIRALTKLNRPLAKIVQNLAVYASLHDDRMAGHRGEAFPETTLLNISIFRLFCVSLVPYFPDTMNGLSGKDFDGFWDDKENICFEVLIGPNFALQDQGCHDPDEPEFFRTFLVSSDDVTYRALMALNERGARTREGALEADAVARTFLANYQRGCDGFMMTDAGKDKRYKSLIELLAPATKKT